MAVRRCYGRAGNHARVGRGPGTHVSPALGRRLASLGARVAETTLGGYSLIRAGSLDAAVALARGCPMLGAGGAVEICELTSHDERFDQWLDAKGGRRD